MKKALLVSHSEQSAVSLAELLRNEGYAKISASYTADSARKNVLDDEFDLICINAPLPDENGIKLSEEFANSTRSSVVIIVPQKNADDVNDLLTKHGVLVIAKPINRHLFHHYLQFTDCFRMRMFRVAEENERLKHMVEDMKVINRAKLLLVTCLNMSEEQAHRYLEKQAMDLRVSKLQIAMQVIKTYEN
ncbi:MAG: response regulator [Ruminococcus bromii]|jgi:response regulator NasT|uniref:ANTAR domain-containing response regulator n=1 Tax=Ruminococcus sp. YE282 TaxID=3158780 RepID=UPI00088C1926|nr:response regulator [Ruminococcus bromii]MCI7210996.1 response regulator [Ruminococcus bromii]MDD6434041.1 response regulator [Ruminococcus bromii]MDY4084843.1 response regulator [Ruminococcus bromii]MDY4711508.1 response regulator [Ruminococcus bromii]